MAALKCFASTARRVFAGWRYRAHLARAGRRLAAAAARGARGRFFDAWRRSAAELRVLRVAGATLGALSAAARVRALLRFWRVSNKARR